MGNYNYAFPVLATLILDFDHIEVSYQVGQNLYLSLGYSK